MKQSFLKGDILILRAPEMEDLEKLFIWENDSSLWHVGNAVAPYSHKQLWDYIDGYEADIFKSRQLRFVIVENETGLPIGTIDLFDFDPINRHASIGIIIDSEYRRKGYASYALNLLCTYCSVHLGIHALLAVTEKDNQSALNLFKKCDFDTCGCLQSWIRRGNRYNDVVFLQRRFNVS